MVARLAAAGVFVTRPSVTSLWDAHRLEPVDGRRWELLDVGGGTGISIGATRLPPRGTGE